MTTEQLSMSMFASQAGYDAAVRAQVEQLPEGQNFGDIAIQRMQAQEARIAELEGERDEWKRIASAYSPQKEPASALTQAKEAGRKARQERNELRSELDDAEVWHLRALILSAGHADTARAGGRSAP